MHVLSGWGLAAHLTEQAPLCATLLLTALIVSAVASLAWCVEKLVLRDTELLREHRGAYQAGSLKTSH